MSRWKAAAIHLLISLVVIGTVGAVLIWLWYGWPLFNSMGGVKLLGILAIVDVVVGPMLTALVFKAGKPSLRFDLTVIAILQMCFLGFGIWIMTQSRPVFLVGVLDRFELVFANEIDAEDYALATDPQYARAGLGAPRIVGGRTGETGEERLDLALSGFAGKDIPRLPARFAPYDAVQKEVRANAKPARDLATAAPASAKALEAAASAAGIALDELVYVPIVSSRGRASMLLRADDGSVVGAVAVDPWPDLPASP